MDSDLKNENEIAKVPSDSESINAKAEAPENTSNMVDWRGRSIKINRPVYGSKSSQFIILGAITCCYFAFGGIYFNLVLYLIEVWHVENAAAANDLTNLLGTVYLTCLAGAFLGDAYLGRILAVAVSLILFMLGALLSAWMVTIQEHSPLRYLTHRLMTFLLVSLFLTAVGCGSYQPVIVALGGDQFDKPKDKARLFSWIFVSSNVGVMLSLTILTYIENSGRWALGFWISSAAVAFSVLLFLLGAPTMRQPRTAGNPLLRIAQVLISAARKWNVTPPTDASQLYETKDDQTSAIVGSRKIAHSSKFRCLDKAATVTEREVGTINGANRWRICTVTQVEEVKCLLKIIPVVMVGIIYNVAVAQLVTLFVVQGNAMDNRLSWRGRQSSFHIPPGSMRLFTNLASIIFTLMYEYLLVPRLSKRFTALHRMLCGLIVTALSMAAAGAVENQRLLSLPRQTTILCLIPQFVGLGASNVLFVVAQIDFFYTEISDGMRSIGSSLFLVCMGLGNYASTLLVLIVTSLSSRHLGGSWIPHNINHGHLDYFYWLITAVIVVTLLFFLLYTFSYTHMQLKPVDGHSRSTSSTSYNPVNTSQKETP